MKSTPYLGLQTIDLDEDAKLSGRTYLSIMSGTGNNNLRILDDNAKTMSEEIKRIKDSPSNVFINATEETNGLYIATVPSITGAMTDLIVNGLYILNLNTTNRVRDITIKINSRISKQVRKVVLNDSGVGVLSEIDIGDLSNNCEYIFRYNGTYLVLIASEAQTFQQKRVSDFVLKSEVVDSLDSISTKLPLSANQGKALDTKIDDVNTALDTKIDNTTDLLFTDFNYVYAPSTGILSLSLIRKDSTEKKVEIDLPLELIIESDSYDSSTKTIILILANSDRIEIPVMDLFDEYFADNSSLELYTQDNKQTFKVKNGGISKIKLSDEVIDEINSKAPIDSPTFTGTVSGIDNTMIGLSNVTDDTQVKRSEMGIPNGVATLNEIRIIPDEQLPSYVSPASLTAHNTADDAHADIRADISDHTSSEALHKTTSDIAEIAKVATKADKSFVLDYILLAANWVGETEPYRYTIENDTVTNTSNQEFLPSTGITKEELKTLQQANIVDDTQTDGSLTIKAFGNKPTINLPIKIIFRGD